MLPPALALLASLLFGVSTILIKIGIERTNTASVVLIVTFAGTIIFLGISLVTVPGHYLKSPSIAYFVIAGVFSPALVRWLYFISLARIGASISSSILATAPAFAAVIAITLLGEKITLAKGFGMLLIISGIILFERDMHRDSTQKLHRTRDLIYPLCAAIFFASALVVRKMGLNILNAPIFGVTVGFTTSFIIYAVMCLMSKKLRNSISLKRNDIVFLCGAAAFLTLSWLVVFYALSIGNVIIVAPLSTLDPLVVVGLSYFFLKDTEKLSIKIITGALIVVCGVVLIAFG